MRVNGLNIEMGREEKANSSHPFGRGN